MSFMPRAVRSARFFALFVALPVALCAQTGFVPANPISPPTVAAPTLIPVSALDPPVVTAPTLSPESAEGGAESTAAKTSAAAKAAASGTDGSKSASSTAATASALSMLGLGSNNSLLKALSGTDSDESGSDALSGLLGSSSSSTDSATLKKVLALLEKQQSGTAVAAGTAASAGTVAAAGSQGATGITGAAAAAEKQTITSGGEMLRFTVNGYDVAASTTALVSSILAKDGSFLLTGDRRYLVSRAARTETYYLLCRKNGDGSYRLHADVTQDSKNEYSFLYRLSRRGPIKGTMTGDLLVFRTVDPDFRLDLVIRVIVPSVSKKSSR